MLKIPNYVSKESLLSIVTYLSRNRIWARARISLPLDTPSRLLSRQQRSNDDRNGKAKVHKVFRLKKEAMLNSLAETKHWQVYLEIDLTKMNTNMEWWNLGTLDLPDRSQHLQHMLNAPHRMSCWLGNTWTHKSILPQGSLCTEIRVRHQLLYFCFLKLTGSCMFYSTDGTYHKISSTDGIALHKANAVVVVT